MLKLLTCSRCTLCTMTLRQLLPYYIRNHSLMVADIDDTEKQVLRKHRLDLKANQDTKNTTIHVRLKYQKIRDVKAVLEKYNINMNELKRHERLLQVSPWTVEQRIMLLQDFGASKIELYQIENFYKRFKARTKFIKADLFIDAESNLAKNIFSSIDNSNINYESVTHLSEDITFKDYYYECLICYIKQKLDISEDKLSGIKTRKSYISYNSFRLLERLLNFFLNDLNFDKTMILKGRWVLSVHPDQAQIVLNMLKENFGDLSYKIISKYPKLLKYDMYDLQIFLSYLKELEATPDNVLKHYQIFYLSPAEFKRRMDILSNNPFTSVYRKHRRFLRLIYNYYIIMARIRYLQEKNLKFCTIHTLTTFSNYVEGLSTSRKINTPNFRYFFWSHFDGDTDKFVDEIKRHPYYACVPLIQMDETVAYLTENYSKPIIFKHICSILYHKRDLIAARDVIMKDPTYSQWSPSQILSLCLYKIEEKYNFTGRAVLCPEDYAEGCVKNLDPEANAEDGTKNN